MIHKFHTGYKEAISGKVGKEEGRVFTELAGGARIGFVFSQIFVPELMRIDPLEGLTAKEIRFAIRNATGPRNALFIPESAFELLVKRQITRLEYPALQCVDHVFAELQRIVASLEGVELARFERLRTEVMSVADAFLHSCRAPCKQMISDLLAIENAYINTSHPDFAAAIHKIQAIRAQSEQKAAAASHASNAPSSSSSKASQSSQSTKSASAVPSQQRQPPMTMAQILANATFGEDPLTDREEAEVKSVQELLVSYFSIVRLNIQDSVPKTIMNLLVKKSESMDKSLMLHLIGKDAPADLLAESPECAERRKICERTVDVLQKAKTILSTVNHSVA